MAATLPAARYKIGEVARMTGMSTHALRAWERRYGTLTPRRTEAGDRLYTDSDVARVRVLKALLSYGHSIGDIASKTDSELSRLLSEHRRVPGGSTEDAVVLRYLDAVEAMDVEGAELVLLRAAASLPPHELIRRVVLPVLDRIGALWETGALCVAQEHASSAIVRSQLGQMLRGFVPGKPFRTAIAATPAGELHEFGALLAAISAAAHGWRVIYLGPNLPGTEVAKAARLAGAELVLLSVVAMRPAVAKAECARLAAQLPERVRVLVGGAGAEELELPHGFRRMGGLTELESELSS